MPTNPTASTTTTVSLRAPFPYFGGKSRIAHLVWQALGDPRVYIEPFLGSAAVLLARPPSAHHREIVNDKDGYLANFWRAVKRTPRAVARWADWPSNEVDLLARHRWLCAVERKRRLLRRLRADPDYCSPKMAGYWVWGISQWIGGRFCDAAWYGEADPRNHGDGIRTSKRPGFGYQGIHADCRATTLRQCFEALSKRLRRVVVCTGDWQRVVTEAAFSKYCSAGIFLDPPYDHSVGRSTNIYSHELVSTATVRDFCLDRGRDSRISIVLAGYDGEYRLPGWKVVPWKASAGMAKSGRGVANRNRERLWLSPACEITPAIRAQLRSARRRTDAQDPRPAPPKSHPNPSGARAPARARARATPRGKRP